MRVTVQLFLECMKVARMLSRPLAAGSSPEMQAPKDSQGKRAKSRLLQLRERCASPIACISELNCTMRSSGLRAVTSQSEPPNLPSKPLFYLIALRLTAGVGEKKKKGSTLSYNGV